MINKFLDLVIEKGASDLHLSSNNIPAIRISGDLVKIGREASSPDFINNIIKEILPKEKSQSFQEGAEIDQSFHYNDLIIL